MRGFYANSKMEKIPPGTNEILVFLHGQRTGGSAFRTKVLREVFGESSIYAFQYVEGWKQWKKLSYRDIGNYSVFTGHSDFCEIPLYRDAKYISIVRHPFYRFVSLYNYVQTREDSPYREIASQNNMKDFLKKSMAISESGFNYFSNLLCRRICGFPSFEMAKWTIENKFFAVGCMEEMSTFAEFISKHFGKEIPELEGVASDYLRYGDLLDDDELVNLVLRHNHEDEKLFYYLNEKYFGLPPGNYPWSRGIAELSATEPDSLIESTELSWEGDEDMEYRVVIRDDNIEEIIAKEVVVGNCFTFDWERFQIDGKYRFRVQKRGESGWDNIENYRGVSPPPKAIFESLTSEERKGLTILKWDCVSEASHFRVLIRSGEEGIIEKIETNYNESLFSWIGREKSSIHKYRIQSWSTEGWVNETPYYTINLPETIVLENSMNHVTEKSRVSHLTINQEVLSDGTNLKIKISLSSPGIPNGVRFLEQEFDRVNRESKRSILGAEGEMLFFSDDLGETWEAYFVPEIGAIQNAFTTSSGRIIVGGKDKEDETLHRVVCLEEFEVISSKIVGRNCWHGTFSIDEGNGVIMFAEYPFNSKKLETHESASVFKSEDGGVSWKEVLREEYPHVRHFHTCTSLGESAWLVTSGDSPEQCRFWKTFDDGENWMEVTNKNPDIRVKESYRQLVHRTVVMQKSAEGWLWATDDPLGPLSEYHHSDGLLTRSKLIFSKLDAKERSSIGRLLERLPIIGKRIKERWNYEVGIQELCDIGMHVRSMVDVGNGFVIITEAKNLEIQSASEVFFVLKSDLSKAHLLFEIPNPLHKPTAATQSRSSISALSGVFFSRIPAKTFDGDHCQLIRWDVEMGGFQ